MKGRGLSKGKGSAARVNAPAIGQRNAMSEIGSRVFFSI